MSDEKLNSEAIRLISRLWRGGTIATINRKSKSGAVNLSKWIKPDELNRVPISDLANVYFSTATATQIPPTNAKGEIVENQYKRIQGDYLELTNALYAEFDAKDYGDKPSALAHIQGLAHKPSVIVDSGGGYHCYWLLTIPFRPNSEPARERLRDAIRAFVSAVGGDKGAKDLARVLRIPGTLNTKYTPSRQVQVIAANYALEYQFEKLEAWCLALIPPTPKPARHVLTTLTPATNDTEKVFDDALTRGAAAISSTPAGARNQAIMKYGAAIGGYIWCKNNGRAHAEAALFDAVAHFSNVAKARASVMAALDYGEARPLEIKPPVDKEENRRLVEGLRKHAEAQQWAGRVWIEETRLDLTTVYKCLSYILDRAHELGFTRLALSGRMLSEATRTQKNRACLVLKWLATNGWLKLATTGDPKLATANVYEFLHPQNGYTVSCITTTTGASSVARSTSVPILRTSASCARRVTITTKHQRMVGSSTQKYKGDVVTDTDTGQRIHFDTPPIENFSLDKVKPIKNWRAPDALRQPGESRSLTYDGLGDTARHVLDILIVSPKTKVELEAMTGKSGETIRRVLVRMAEAGMIERGARGCVNKLIPGWDEKLNQFYELGNVRLHVARIAARNENERKNFAARQAKRTPMTNEQRSYDAAAALLNATTTTTATSTAALLNTTTTTTATSTATPIMNIASSDERTPTPAPDFDDMLFEWLDSKGYAPQVEQDGRLLAIREGAT